MTRLGRETLRVLLVDDSDEDRAAARAALRAGSTRRYAITEQASGAAGIAALIAPDGAVDCCIVDNHLIDCEAVEFITRVRAAAVVPRLGALPIVAMTAFASAEDKRRTLREGFNVHLAKPADPAELCSVLAGLVGRATK